MTNQSSNTRKQSVKLFDNLLSYEELSQWLNVPKKTVQDWVYKREIPYVKIRKHVRFSRSEVFRWFTERNEYGDFKE